jgi:hypothetical protein
MHIKNKARRLILLLCVALLSGCVEFEHQVLTYSVVDNELIIFQEYHGIYGEAPEKSDDKKTQKKKTDLTDAEKQEIHSIIYGERTFFFNNWITEYHRAELLEEVTRLEHPGKQLSASDKQQRRIWLPLIKLLLASVSVSNGEFYFDSRRRLSGYQVVRVKNVNQLVAQANHSISMAILEEKTDPDADDQERKLLARQKALAEAGHNWIEVNGNLINVSFPASQKEFLEAESEAKAYSSISSRALAVAYREGLMAISIGHPGDEPVIISKQLPGPYTTNAVNHIMSEYGINETLDIANLKQAAFE